MFMPQAHQHQTKVVDPFAGLFKPKPQTTKKTMDFGNMFQPHHHHQDPLADIMKGMFQPKMQHQQQPHHSQWGKIEMPGFEQAKFDFSNFKLF